MDGSRDGMGVGIGDVMGHRMGWDWIRDRCGVGDAMRMDGMGVGIRDESVWDGMN